MRNPSLELEISSAVENDPRWELVERIVASPSFIRSPRLCSLLMHLCELALHGRSDERRVTTALQRVLNIPHFKTRAAAFAAHHRGFDPGHATDNIVDEIESLAAHGKQGSSNNNASRVAMDG